jgi:hypothetical protein
MNHDTQIARFPAQVVDFGQGRSWAKKENQALSIGTQFAL